jgi:hypothetical protein
MTFESVYKSSSDEHGTMEERLAHELRHKDFRPDGVSSIGPCIIQHFITSEAHSDSTDRPK